MVCFDPFKLLQVNVPNNPSVRSVLDALKKLNAKGIFMFEDKLVGPSSRLYPSMASRIGLPSGGYGSWPC
jgi:hypothetical protein